MHTVLFVPQMYAHSVSCSVTLMFVVLNSFSQVSIEVSTVTSSGYQSLSHTQSRSHSPADSSTHPQHVQELTREITRSPVILFQAVSVVTNELRTLA